MLLLAHIVPFAVRPALIGGDEPHYALAAHSLALDRDLALEDDYAEVEAGSNAAGRKRAGTVLDRHLRDTPAGPVFAHPIGLPLLAAPILWLQHLVAPGSAPDLLLGLLTVGLTFAGLVAGVRLLAEWAEHPQLGALVALAVYFGSPLWFASRTFMTEPYLLAFTLLGLASWRAERAFAAAACFFLALAVKETAVLLVGPIVLGALLHARFRRAWPLVLGPALFGAFFVGKNLVQDQPPLATFQPYQAQASLEGVLGFLVDPARGLLWFAPVLVIACAGWPRLLAQPTTRRVGWLAGASCLAIFLLAAFWIDWRGGSSYGPRLILPALPALALPLLALVESRPSRWLQGLLAAAFAVGFAVNWSAALNPVTAFWSAPVQTLLLDRPFTSLAGLTLGTALAVSGWRRWREIERESIVG